MFACLSWNVRFKKPTYTIIVVTIRHQGTFDLGIVQSCSISNANPQYLQTTVMRPFFQVVTFARRRCKCRRALCLPNNYSVLPSSVVLWHQMREFTLIHYCVSFTGILAMFNLYYHPPLINYQVWICHVKWLMTSCKKANFGGHIISSAQQKYKTTLSSCAHFISNTRSLD